MQMLPQCFGWKNGKTLVRVTPPDGTEKDGRARGLRERLAGLTKIGEPPGVVSFVDIHDKHPETASIKRANCKPGEIAVKLWIEREGKRQWVPEKWLEKVSFV